LCGSGIGCIGAPEQDGQPPVTPILARATPPRHFVTGSEVVNISKTSAKVDVIPAQERHPGMTLSGAGIQVVHLIEFRGRKPCELDSGLRRE
jgi:hypothetical protein